MRASDAVENDIDAIPGEAPHFLHEVGVFEVDGGTAQTGDGPLVSPATRAVHPQIGKASQFEQGCSDATHGAVNQRALFRLDAHRAMQHLVAVT